MQEWRIVDKSWSESRREKIYARKKEHAIRRCAQRCELRYKDYKRMVRDREAEMVLRESNSRKWYAFEEPSGKSVYGLFHETREIFYTFITEEMFTNRLRYEEGDLSAYHPGSHREAAAA